MNEFILGIPEPSIIFYGGSKKEVMRLNGNGVIVNPEMPLDEAAQHVINLLDAQIQHLVRSEREEVIAEFVKSGAVSEDGTVVADIRARGNT